MKSTKVQMFFFVIVFIFTAALNADTARGEIFYPLPKLKPHNHTPHRPLRKEEKTKITIPKLTLSGIIVSKSSKFALINGHYLKEGDKIGICTVEKIHPTTPTVTLNCNGIKVKLKINLTE